MREDLLREGYRLTAEAELIARMLKLEMAAYYLGLAGVEFLETGTGIAVPEEEGESEV